jgi:hypothetical protein
MERRLDEGVVGDQPLDPRDPMSGEVAAAQSSNPAQVMPISSVMISGLGGRGQHRLQLRGDRS